MRLGEAEEDLHVFVQHRCSRFRYVMAFTLPTVIRVAPDDDVAELQPFIRANRGCSSSDWVVFLCRKDVPEVVTASTYDQTNVVESLMNELSSQLTIFATSFPVLLGAMVSSPTSDAAAMIVS